MSLLRQPLLLLARSGRVKGLVSTMPVSAGIVRSYVPGEDTQDAVRATAELVDDHLRVRGMEGLRVIDASIMPAMLSANLNAATMMIAEKGADLVLGKPALEAIILPEERAA